MLPVFPVFQPQIMRKSSLATIRQYTTFITFLTHVLVSLSFAHLPGYFNEQYDCVRYGIKELSPGWLIAVTRVTALKPNS